MMKWYSKSYMYTKFPIFLSNWTLLFVIANDINSSTDIPLTVECYTCYTYTCVNIFDGIQISLLFLDKYFAETNVHLNIGALRLFATQEEPKSVISLKMHVDLTYI